MDATEARTANLKLLIQEVGSQVKLSKMIETPPPVISQIITGHRNMGHEVARRIEQKMGKHHGWMDQDHVQLRLIENENFDPISTVNKTEDIEKPQKLSTKDLKDSFADELLLTVNEFFAGTELIKPQYKPYRFKFVVILHEALMKHDIDPGSVKLFAVIDQALTETILSPRSKIILDEPQQMKLAQMITNRISRELRELKKAI